LVRSRIRSSSSTIRIWAGSFMQASL